MENESSFSTMGVALDLALAAERTRERAISEFADPLYVALVLATDFGLMADEVTASLADNKRAASSSDRPR